MLKEDGQMEKILRISRMCFSGIGMSSGDVALTMM